ncbi:MAG: methyltransferase domain-containing protein [Pirellulales bacterium]|nr:methyltransferase domain-containing protein [Pirellulales bacterium]
MNGLHQGVVDNLAEVFGFREPVYEFGYCPCGGTGRRMGAAPRDFDRHEDLARLPYSDRSARTVLCRGAIEFVAEPRRAVEEMLRICMPGGLLVVVAAGQGSPTSGPGQLWHVTPTAVQRLLAPLPATVVGWLGPDHAPRVVFGVGCKAPVSPAMVQGAARLARLANRDATSVAAPATRLGRLWRQFVRRAAPRNRSPLAPLRVLLHLPLDRASCRDVLEGCLRAPGLGSRLDLNS